MRVEGAGERGLQRDLVVALGDVLAGEEERADAARAGDHVRRVVQVEAAAVAAAEEAGVLFKNQAIGKGSLRLARRECGTYEDRPWDRRSR